MSKPVPGSQYTIVAGDTLSRIASQAYGDSVYSSRIQQANPSIINPDEIVAGSIINIPILAERQKLKTEQAAASFLNKNKEQFTLIVDDLEIPVLSGSVMRTMDTVADAWSAVIAWTPGEDLKLDKRLKPFSYPPASVYLGNDLMVNGVLYTVAPSLMISGQQIELEGSSYTTDIIDSVVTPPYEVNNVTLENRARDLIQPIGINVEFDIDSGGPFDRITARPTQSIFSHLVGLATQRGFLLSSTPGGDLLFLKAITEGKSVATLSEEEGQRVSEWRARYDGRNRHHQYRAIGQNPFSNSTGAVAIDSKVPRSRFMTFTANDTTDGNIIKAAEWRRAKQVARAFNLIIPVSGWYDSEGKLWEPNTLVTVQSKSLFIPEGFTFLIKSVGFYYGNDFGASLSLVPPQVYSGEEIKEPW